ncbi:MAG: histidinol dehydrogenase, partial [Gemmatimonadota bacterium]
ARTFDGAELASIEVPREEWRRALGRCDIELVAALHRAAENIMRVHTACMPAPVEIEVEPGVRIVRRPVGLDRVGIYAPGGRAAYASSLLMGVIPAWVAGVGEVVVCSPASRTGLPSALVLAAAEVAGASRVFAVGGAGAIAAMALGTESIPRVDCIVGPGNAYVTEAKQQVARDVRIESPAGPTEILVLLDDTADMRAVAAELLAQAEHGIDSAAVAVAIGRDAAMALNAELERELQSLEHSDTIRKALGACGALLIADSIEEALAFAEGYAPEHLLIATRNAAAAADQVRNAACTFVGCSSSVTFGDYMTGANHVLPTAGYARTHSGLGTDAFVRWTTTQYVDPTAARTLGPAVSAFAGAEGLTAHARAARYAGLLP